MSQSQQRRPEQLELLFDAPKPVVVAAAPAAPAKRPEPAPAPAAPASPVARGGLRVIQGGGQKTTEPLDNRNAVVRVLVEAGADLLLRRISPARAEAIERNVNKILGLFDRVDATPELMPVLRRELDELEALMAETRALRTAR